MCRRLSRRNEVLFDHRSQGVAQSVQGVDTFRAMPPQADLVPDFGPPGLLVNSPGIPVVFEVKAAGRLHIEGNGKALLLAAVSQTNLSRSLT